MLYYPAATRGLNKRREEENQVELEVISFDFCFNPFTLWIEQQLIFFEAASLTLLWWILGPHIAKSHSIFKYIVKKKRKTQKLNC